MLNPTAHLPRVVLGKIFICPATARTWGSLPFHAYVTSTPQLFACYQIVNQGNNK